MKRRSRNRRIWMATLGVMVVAVGILVSVMVLAGDGDGNFTATPYADVIRFEVEGVASLQVQIYDLSGKELWDSGVVSGSSVDWDRRNEWGERLAYGAYLYAAQGWDVGGDLVLQKKGKLALLPGDKVQLQVAPPVSSSGGEEAVSPSREEPRFGPKAQIGTLADTGIFGTVGIGTVSPIRPLHIYHATKNSLIWMESGDQNANFVLADPGGYAFFEARNGALGLSTGSGASRDALFIDTAGKVGIGTTGPGATLEVHGSASNLLALYDPVNGRVFRVEKDGDVRADGSYWGAGGVYTGGADVAERINTSEWVEAGHVVEIDPDHPGFFRKTCSSYSTMVAGIISTSPGVVLGNNSDVKADRWEDNRPMLALAGRVPVKVATENGPIQIGDLLVSSSQPGYAMRCSDRAACVGAVIGKALEPLKEGNGTIMVQVMLR